MTDQRTYTDQLLLAIRKGIEAHMTRLEHELLADPAAGYSFDDPLLSIRIAFKSTRKGPKCEWRATVKFAPQEETGVLELDHPDQKILLPV